MRPLPLKLFMTTDAVGGVFAYAVDLARGLAIHDIEVELAVLGPAVDARHLTAAQVVPGLTLHRLDLPLDWLAETPGAVATAAAALAEAAADARADVVQLNAPAFAVADYPCPVVGVLHSCLATWWRAVKNGPLPADFAWRTGLLADGLSRCDAIVCPSRALADAAEAIYGLRPRVVHNGRAAPPAVAPATVPAAFAFTAGRLWDEGKDVATLDAAAGLMCLPLVAAGPLVGPHGGRVALRHAEAAGTLDDDAVRAYLADAPIFISAALYEPFGLAVLEAAQAGCPLVLSDIATFRELWDGAALFIPPRDAAGFAAAVDGIAADPALRRRLGRAARARSRRLGLAPQAEAMAALFRTLAPGRAMSTQLQGAMA
jgi:glycosyltransferase involved in cell wall biosynthesis